MLEAHSHKKLKQILQRNPSSWPNHLTLGRLVARSIRRKDKTLIQLDPFSQNSWWLGLLFPLCLGKNKAVLVVSDQQRRRLLNFEIPRLSDEGFPLACWEGVSPPLEDQLWILSHYELIEAFRCGFVKSRQLIFPEADLLSRRFREAMNLSITHEDWERLLRAHPQSQSDLLDIYENLTQSLFAKSLRLGEKIQVEESELLELKDLIQPLNPIFEPWTSFLKLKNYDWVASAELNHKCLNWNLTFHPLEPFNLLFDLFNYQPFLLITCSGENRFFQNELSSANISLNVIASLNQPSSQEPISLFAPFRQPMPNTEIFKGHLLEQSRRLILGRSGITVLLLDDSQLRRQLTSELAGEFGTRVVHESTDLDSNGVVCCSWSWWLSHHPQVPLPEQLIIALFPLGSLESPLVAARVALMKRHGRDWFRDFLLPEALSLFPSAVAPLRLNKGRVAILDGRLRGRSWGPQILRALEPWTPLHRLLPD